MALLLALDGGQTGTRALLARTDGTALGEGAGPPIRHMFSGGGGEARAAIQSAVQAALATAGVDGAGVLAAVSGVTSVQPDSPEAALVEHVLREVIQPEQVVVVPDYVTNLLGASCGEPGVVVAAGGGSVAYGRAADGREAVAGGFGYLLGDEGGGYDIGRRAITAAIRAHDGRDVPTALEDGVKAAFSVSDLPAIKRIVYTPEFSRDRVAALVPLVARTAGEGDEVARRIMTEAGVELAHAALAVVHRLFAPGETVTVYPTGGVFKAGEVVLRPFREALVQGWPTALVGQPRYPPVLGALILAQELCSLPIAVPGWSESA